MTKVFIGGSRRANRLDEEVLHRLDRIVEKRLPVAVGDANGADKAVQQYLKAKSYDLVEVFCSGMRIRNNVGGWPVRAVTPRSRTKDFDYYAAKDRAMAEEASAGLMIWDGDSIGTLMNVFRLVRRKKATVIYLIPSREFINVKNEKDWEKFLLGHASALHEQVERKAAEEPVNYSSNAQTAFF